MNKEMTITNAQCNLPVSRLVEKTLSRKEAIFSSTGAICTTTGKYTGRSPKDKYIVEEQTSKDDIDWEVNQPISPEIFESLHGKVIDYLNEKEEVFQFVGFAGSDQKYRLPIQVFTEFAWHNLFAHQLFVRPTQDELENHVSEFTVICAPNFKANPDVDRTNSEAFIIISFERRTVIIGGTEYAGEIKKAVFSVMNYILPKQEVLSMHCSANVGKEGDVSLFFGLSGTGKTTLSADQNRKLIGDDEHGWSTHGIFNIEGGCYAKCVDLSEEKEPKIWNAIQFGSVLENVMINKKTRIADYHDVSLTENTRAAYPIDCIDNIVRSSLAGHPNTIIFLTADAFGILPPISLLTKEQAMYHFLSGYTSKLAGTERGVTKPEATFSACFGSPFLPLPAIHYAKMLGEKIDQYDTKVYLVNTGWTGGPYGIGDRMNLKYTRAMVRAALENDLNLITFNEDPVFGLQIPEHCPGVPDAVLNPRNTWHDKNEYDKNAEELAMKFNDNFRQFEFVPETIKSAAPLFKG